MKAPSEKHLEDWIKNNFDLFGEWFPKEWLPDDIALNMRSNSSGEVMNPVFDRLIATQYRFPAGIADLIASSKYSIDVVELKKGSINYAHLAQCMRYVYALRKMFESVYVHWGYEPHDAPPELPSRTIVEREIDYLNEEVGGVLVGHSISDDNLPIIAATSGIRIALYDYDGDGYTFRFADLSNNAIRTKSDNLHMDYLDPVVTEIGFVIDNLSQAVRS